MLSARTRTPVAQVAISLAEAEAGIADTVRYHEPRETPVSLPDWWRGSDAPLIYVTFGMVLGYMSIAAETYRMALKAVERINARVLLTVGRRFDASKLGPIPANVHVEPWVDQAQVLNPAELVVCHGGSGTTLAALAAGVPLVMVPLFADQFENSRRIAEIGAGRVVETRTSAGGARSMNAAAVPEVTRSIEDALADVTYRDRARAMAAEITATPTVEEILTRLPSGVVNRARRAGFGPDERCPVRVGSAGIHSNAVAAPPKSTSFALTDLCSCLHLLTYVDILSYPQEGQCGELDEHKAHEGSTSGPERRPASAAGSSATLYRPSAGHAGSRAADPAYRRGIDGGPRGARPCSSSSTPRQAVHLRSQSTG